MNQIIKKPNLEALHKHSFTVEFSNEVFELDYEDDKLPLKKTTIIKNYLRKNKYPLQFFISAFVAIIFLIILYYNIYNSNKQEKLAKELLNNYTLTTLYQNKPTNLKEVKKQTTIIENPFVIGMIKIPKINLNYPILSESNADLLKISLCRFAGPMPNEIR